MNKNKDSLLVVNENSVFYKIKTFFKRLFSKEDELSNQQSIQEMKPQDDRIKKRKCN